MDLIFEDQTVNGAKVDDPFGVVHAHVLAKVRISEMTWPMPRWTMMRSGSKASREALRCTTRWLTDLLCL
jgi:hypothetical protein